MGTYSTRPILFWYLLQEASPLPAQLMPVAAAIQEVSPPAARGQQSRAVAPSAQQGAPGTVTGARSTSPPDSEANGVDGEATSQAQATDSELMAPAQVVAPPAAPVAIRLTKPGKAGGMRALLGRNKKAGGSAMAGGLARANGASTPEGVSQVTTASLQPLSLVQHRMQELELFGITCF